MKHVLGLVLALAVAVPYFSGLRNGFVWLDQLEIVEGAMIAESPAEFVQAFREPRFYAGYYRPFYVLAHSIDRALWGLEASGFYLSSLVLHVTNVLLVFVLMSRLGWKRLESFALALLWGLHPVNTAVAGLIHSKADLIVCTAALAALLFLERSLRAPRQLLPIIFFGACSSVALATKELAFVLPLGMTALLWDPATGLDARTRKAAVGPVVLAWSLALLFLAYRIFGMGMAGESSPIGLFMRLATFGTVYCEYLGKLLLPIDLTVADTVTTYAAMPLLPRTTLTALFVGLLVAQLWAAQRLPSLRPWIVIFNLSLLPVAQIVPILHFRADRFLYLPSLALLGCALEGLRLWRASEGSFVSSKAAEKLAQAALVVVCLLYAVAIRQRLPVFQNDEVFFQTEVRRTPDYKEGLSILARHYDSKMQHSLAEEYWRRCIEPAPGRISYMHRDGVILGFSFNLLAQHKPGEAVRFLETVGPSVEDPKYQQEALYNLAVAAHSMGDHARALPLLEGYARDHPGAARCRYLLGQSALRLEKLELARRSFVRYLELAPKAHDRKAVEEILSSISE